MPGRRNRPSTSFTPGKETLIPSKIFVGNLNFKTTSGQIEDLFTEVGDVLEVIVPTDRNTGRPRGFAFVEFADPETMNEAIKKFDGYELDGRQLRVNEAEARPPRPPRAPRSGGWSDDGPGFGGGGGGRPNFPPPGKPKGSRRNLRGKKRSL